MQSCWEYSINASPSRCCEGIAVGERIAPSMPLEAKSVAKKCREQMWRFCRSVAQLWDNGSIGRRIWVHWWHIGSRDLSVGNLCTNILVMMFLINQILISMLLIIFSMSFHTYGMTARVRSFALLWYSQERHKAYREIRGESKKYVRLLTYKYFWYRRWENGSNLKSVRLLW